jgi:hypothetical protein
MFPESLILNPESPLWGKFLLLHHSPLGVPTNWNTCLVSSLFLMVSFSSTPEMISYKPNLQAPRRRRTSLFTNFHEEDTTTQPPSQLGGHPPRVTCLWSLTRIIVMESSTLMQEYKATKAAQILHSHPTKATNARKELVTKNKGESQQMTPRSRSKEFSSHREEMSWWRL